MRNTEGRKEPSMDLIKELMYKLADKEVSINGIHYHVYSEETIGSFTHHIYIDKEVPLDDDDEDDEIIGAFNHNVSYHILSATRYIAKYNHNTMTNEPISVETLIDELNPFIEATEI